MELDLEPHEIRVLLESLEYSKQRVRDAQGTPYDVRNGKLSQLQEVGDKLRQVLKSSK